MNRREFISGAAGVMLASPNVLWGADAPSNRVRLAVAGVWEKGRGKFPMMRAAEMPGVEVAAVVDVDSRARDWAAAKVKEMTGREPMKFADIRKLLERPDIDGVVAEVPDHWHAPMTWLSMQAGKHVYCEKPCIFCASEGDVLLDVQRKTGKVFQMGNQRRSSIAYQRCIADIRAGVIGEPKYARTWYRNNRKPIGVGKVTAPPEWLDWDLWQGPAPRAPYRDNLVHYNWHWFFHYGTGEIANNAVHYVDVARWALGVDLPVKVSALGNRAFGNDDWEWPDTQMISCEFPGKKLITWEGLSCCPGQKPSDAYAGAMVYGPKGSILFHPEDYCQMCDGKGRIVREWRADDVAAGFCKKWKDKLDYWHVENFAEAIRANDPTVARSPVRDGVTSSLVCYYANISERCGETVRIDPATGKLIGKAGAAFWGREYEKGWEYVG